MVPKLKKGFVIDVILIIAISWFIIYVMYRSAIAEQMRKERDINISNMVDTMIQTECIEHTPYVYKCTYEEEVYCEN